MAITVELALNREEQDQLGGILEHGGIDLDTALQPYAQAALEEYVRMFGPS